MSTPGLEVQYARLLKPFPTKRLADGLYQLLADARALDQALTGILVDTPTTLEAWCQALQELTGLAMSIEERAIEAQGFLSGLWHDAPEQYETAVSAMTAALKGMRDG